MRRKERKKQGHNRKAGTDKAKTEELKPDFSHSKCSAANCDNVDGIQTRHRGGV